MTSLHVLNVKQAATSILTTCFNTDVSVNGTMFHCDIFKSQPKRDCAVYCAADCFGAKSILQVFFVLLQVA